MQNKMWLIYVCTRISQKFCNILAMWGTIQKVQNKDDKPPHGR